MTRYLRVIAIGILMISATSIYAQTNESQTIEEGQKKESKSDEVFVIVDKMPEFLGGMKVLLIFLEENIQYPTEAHEMGIEGKVIVSFVIEKNGKATNVEIIRGINPLFDAEATRMIPLMPKWQAGELNGEIVRVKFILPVVFKITPEDENGLLERDDISVNQTSVLNTINEDEVFVDVETQPEFPGGIKALMTFLAKSMQYPVKAVREGIQGRVITNFIVHKDGTISDINIEKGVDPLLDAEALRVVSSMPKWSPGIEKGEPVNVRFTLPLIFRLEGDRNMNQNPFDEKRAKNKRGESWR